MLPLCQALVYVHPYKLLGTWVWYSLFWTYFLTGRLYWYLLLWPEFLLPIYIDRKTQRSQVISHWILWMRIASGFMIPFYLLLTQQVNHFPFYFGTWSFPWLMGCLIAIPLSYPPFSTHPRYAELPVELRPKPQLPQTLLATIESDCTICLEQIEVNQLECSLPCAHSFHPECISEWWQRDTSCPNCRAAYV